MADLVRRGLLTAAVWRLVMPAVVSAALPAVSSAAAPQLDLSSLRGRVVYLDFWASWCIPCRQSFPWMQQMQRQYSADGLVVVAINLDHSHMDAERFLRTYPTQLQLLFDPEGTLATRFGVEGMPTSLLIDRHGAARFTHTGFLPRERATYEAQIRALLSEH